MGKKASNAEAVDTPRIVAGAMAAVGKAHFGTGPRPQNARADFIAACQVDATEKCYALGIHDPDVIKSHKRRAKEVAELSLQGAIDKHLAKLAEEAGKLSNSPADVRRSIEIIEKGVEVQKGTPAE